MERKGILQHLETSIYKRIHGSSKWVGPVISLLCFVPVSIVSQLLFIKEKMFTVAYLGGQATFRARDYSDEEMSYFMETVTQAKENYLPQNNEFVSAQKHESNINATAVNVVEELRKYKALLEAGTITENEFDELKNKIIK